MTKAVSTSGALAYSPQGLCEDEVFRGTQAPQSHWRYLLDGLETLGAEALRARQIKAERILRDDGASYRTGISGNSRPWPLDLVPFLLESEEWALVESGLRERAELLNWMLEDLYGERELIRHGVLPPELIFSHPGFLRPCQGIRLPGEHQLIFHAADLMRGPDGDWQVLGDRTQAPSGAGYALENRSVMARVLPSLFRNCHVHPLTRFFQSLRQQLLALARHLSDSPRIVILTPGALSETHFEHAHLANYLGFPLVQGSDLQVSQGHLWMKSLQGREPVHLVVRRVDDFFCDPVELRSDSRLGVPGLLECAREGRVLVVNPLGSGLLENPALLRYLPAIGRHVLGRELQLASVPSYWCGDPQDLAYVLEHLDDLVIKPAFRRTGEESLFGADLSAEGKRQWSRRLRRQPFAYAAQRRIQPPAAPSWDGRRLVARPALVRAFTVAGPSSYAVLPGGLTRAGPHDDSINLSNRLGAISKDTWILASEPEPPEAAVGFEMTAPRATVPGIPGFPCRVVENLFWMGRYAERAEAVLRLLRSLFVQFNSSWQMPAETRQLLLQGVTRMTGCYPGFLESRDGRDREAELRTLLLDAEHQGSLAFNLGAFNRCTEEVRELLSADTQSVINDLDDELGLLTRRLEDFSAAPEEALDPLVTRLSALAGLWQDSMVRGLGWHFLDMGRRLEKALQAGRLLQALLVPVLQGGEQNRVLETVMNSAEMLISFRRRAGEEGGLAVGLALLLKDSANPRSMQFQVDALRRHLESLPGDGPGQELRDDQRQLLQAATELQLAPLDSLTADTQGRRAALDLLLSQQIELLEAAAAGIARRYFDRVKAHQQLGRAPWSADL